MLIVENARQYLDAFIQLNEQWIVRYFELEDADKQIAATPTRSLSREATFLPYSTKTRFAVSVRCATTARADLNLPRWR